MIVVDTNIIVYSVVQVTQTALAHQVAARDPDWILPPLWKYEFTSAVTKMTRGLALTTSQAEDAIKAANQLVAGREMDVDQIAAFRIAQLLKMSAYDATYIALAENLGVHCVTADVPMAQKAPRIAVILSDFANGVIPP